MGHELGAPRFDHELAWAYLIEQDEIEAMQEA